MLNSKIHISFYFLATNIILTSGESEKKVLSSYTTFKVGIFFANPQKMLKKVNFQKFISRLIFYLQTSFLCQANWKKKYFLPTKKHLARLGHLEQDSLKRA